jgi:uncharacterized protein YbaP (TraB family)
VKLLHVLLRWLAFLPLLLAQACGEAPPAPPPDGGPALWRVQGHGIDGWLLGTIHVLPSDVEWRTDKIDRAIQASDRLVLETADIQDPARTTATFEKMGRSPGLPPLAARVPAADRAALDSIARDGNASAQLLSRYESWAAAMLLSAAAQKQQLDISSNTGVESALIAVFREEERPISGLETAARQFTAFDTLPESAQRQLLVRTVRDAKSMRALYDHILKAWLRGDIAAIAQADAAGEPLDPLVRRSIFGERNRQWAAEIDKLKGRPFIAVGTGHLTGPDNMVQLLEARGYTVTRAQ